MKQPDSTYRLQLSPNFTFEDLHRILDYLEDFGISTIYSAPFFQAREGSSHGYDVVDPMNLNREIGDLKQFKSIGDRLKTKQMTWLQDIVPNHMAFDSGNPWLQDIFELGPESRFYNFFDINWDYKGLGKVMAPFLGNSLEEVLKNEELRIKLDTKGFSLNYYDNSYPLSVRSYSKILSESGAEDYLKKFSEFSGSSAAWESLKISFLRELDKDKDLEEKIREGIERINKSKEEVQKILDLQYFLPTHWKRTEKEINYRRFFTINDLICLSMEDPAVFETYHYFIKELCDNGLINGLRIDHVDGLFDPEEYLQRLREMLGPDFFIIVEKILEAEEKLPVHWPVQGTSGYEFLARVNHLFTDSSSKDAFNENYEKISPRISDYEALVYKKKLFILKERMGGELKNLCSLLNDLIPEATKKNQEKWEEALSSFLAAFPVYRIYPKEFPLKPRQMEIIDAAYRKALENLEEDREELDYLKKLFQGETDTDKDKTFYFLQRCQQFSGPLAAKGVEDTSFYIYNRLVAHNEVGDSPENFGISVEDFHQKMLKRRKDFPVSINATATHDTKRGEDSRMRLDVLSEIPEEWFTKVSEWKEINSKIRKSKKVPGKNEEYFIYQTLIGAMPFNEENDFFTRTCDYLQKVLREAKVHSNWAEPDEEYEKEVFQFVKDILENQEFRNSFDSFQDRISGLGAIKSLGQSLIKITAPGIPDTYQGTELWDFSYVDPDNRRPVDYDLRMRYMADFRAYNKSNIQEEMRVLKKNFSTGKIKMFTQHKALLQRRRDQDLFQKGEYQPLSISGKYTEKFIAYARVLGDEWRIVVAPVLVAELFDPENFEIVNEHFEDLEIKLPDNAPSEWDHIFTGKTFLAEEKIKLKESFSDFPIIFLKNRKETWS